jgi:subtilisin family serine protease
METKLILCLGLGLLLGLANAARVEPDLLRRLEAAGNPNQKFAVSFTMKDQARALDLDPNIPNLPKPERRARVGRVLMDFAEASQQDLLSYLRAREAEGKVDCISPLWIVNAIGCGATRDVIHEVADRADVELVCHDRVPCELGSLSTRRNQNAEKRKANAGLPDTSDFASQFSDFCALRTDGIPPNTDLINVRGAWNQGYHGEGVVIGFVDTGTWWTHLDLRNHLWTSDAYPHCGFNFASYQCNPPGPSPYDTLTPLCSSVGGGTVSAGIATADGTCGLGVRETLGIAPAARILEVVVNYTIHSPYPDTVLENNIMAGIQFCIRPPRDTLNGADVITMSLGLITSWIPSQSKWRIVEENVLTAGLVHTLAAGNEANPGTIRCPGNCPPPWPNPANGFGGLSAAITVGATDNNDNRASFSSEGPTDVWDSIPPWYDYAYPPGLTDPDMVMPGVNILSTYSGSDTISGNENYTTFSGTSTSTPAVAGVVSLMLSKNPNLTPREIDSIIELYGVRDLGPTGKDNSFGAGRINCSLAVAYTPLSSGVADKRPMPDVRPVTPVPTIIRGVIQVDSRQYTAHRGGAELLDSSGRKVLDLTPGPNDISRLAPGVYFVRSASRGQRSAVSKVVITR